MWHRFIVIGGCKKQLDYHAPRDLSRFVCVVAKAKRFHCNNVVRWRFFSEVDNE